MNQMVAQSLQGVGLPSLAVMIASAVWFGVFRKHPRLRAIGTGLIFAGGIIWAYLLAFGGFAFPPRESGQWIPYLAGAVALVGCLQGIRLGLWRQVSNLVLSLGTALIFFWSEISGNRLTLVWIIGVTVVLFLSTILLQQVIEDRCSGAELSLGLALSAGAGGIVSFLGGSAVLGQLSGSIGAILGVIAVLAFFFNVTIGSVLPLVYLFIFGSLLLSGCLFAELPWLTAVLLWIAPWGLVIGQRLDHPKISSRAKALVIRMLSVIALVAIAICSAFLLVPPSSEL
ncbi:MAG: hypothetical protein JOZ31_14385 [Verrucomicrobia bacterium]|nr:hypothetical protein [Verrucomicrobiota bacterium]MBV8481359.1 hypothetical protein [Verrucomicrobiota bacterium]